MTRFLSIAIRLSGFAGTLFVIASAAEAQTQARSQMPQRPVHTYSIVARDPATGELGVAVQSHWFSVGSIVTWAEAGIGAVATQSFVDPSYGKLGLDLMRAGRSAPDALKALLAGDEGRDVRQVAMIDAQGRVAAHTGSKDIPAAGHIVGKDYSVQANLMLNDKVWPAMSRAFEAAKGDLAERMMAALDAAQEVGGDIRGKQSAALIVVTGKPTGKPWADRVFDLRVDDSADPLKELRTVGHIAARLQPYERGRSCGRAQRQRSRVSRVRRGRKTGARQRRDGLLARGRVGQYGPRRRIAAAVSAGVRDGQELGDADSEAGEGRPDPRRPEADTAHRQCWKQQVARAILSVRQTSICRQTKS